MKSTAGKNMLSTPKVSQLEAMKFIGYKITTTLKNNQQKEDIPPFYHKIYDNSKLDILKSGGEFKMYCIFDLHENQEDLDYYVAVENKTTINDKTFAQIQLPAGKYIQVELLKKNNKTVSMIMMYIKNMWMKTNGYKERNAPAFILYDERFHTNYQKFGCKGNDYLGNPLAVLYLPIDD
ncbi:MAG: effector binding domain-containing protein [Bacteroidales bacterium]|nr:effector binding domain-containing protein [Bacteroidales bacterium]